MKPVSPTPKNAIGWYSDDMRVRLRSSCHWPRSVRHAVLFRALGQPRLHAGVARRSRAKGRSRATATNRARRATVGDVEVLVIVKAVDPGYEQSAIVEFDGHFISRHETLPNAEMLKMLACGGGTLVIEQIESYGMAVGREVFETVFWSGRFAQAWKGTVERMPRRAVKLHLCGNNRAKDTNIRTALLDRFGPGKAKAVGCKAAPGALYGVKADEWAALAVAVTWWDQQLSTRKAG